MLILFNAKKTATLFDATPTKWDNNVSSHAVIAYIYYPLF